MSHTVDDFLRTLASSEAPEWIRSNGPLLALWYDKRDDWQRAHELVQDDPSREAAHIHAYLHRKEGDLGNARYWYRTARVDESKAPLDVEWSSLVASLVR